MYKWNLLADSFGFLTVFGLKRFQLKLSVTLLQTLSQRLTILSS